MKIGVLGKLSKVKSVSVIDEFVKLLRDAGYETVVFQSPLEIADVDVVIVLGGDGAILHSALPCARLGVKIIGVNYGNLGFLTEYEKDEKTEIIGLLRALEQGECRILKRSVLQIEVGDKTFFALNEVAVQRDYGVSGAKSTQILRVSIETGEGVDEVAGDGVLVCTPTGSTAYSLSAGGAILTPEAPVLMVTPVCAFSMRTRPTVYADNETFILTVERGKGILLADGFTLARIGEGVTVRVKKAPFTADFPTKNRSGFFHKVKNKLND